MTRKNLVLLIFLILALSGCQSTPENLGALSGRVILWHSWTPNETLVLEQALAEFREINPQVTIVALALSSDQLLEQFQQSAKDGLGPDLLLGSKDWIGNLANVGLIRPLEDSEVSYLNLDTRATRMMEYQSRVYGVPLSVSPNALYYNKSLVDRFGDSSLDFELAVWTDQPDRRGGIRSNTPE